ncbi:hypothetical protein [Aureimonas sp. AU12]|uniref:hypothetical protein n=1 Tax=Aureimonas sp. AU12 TaxID=1638161 RepID=UPI000781789D|nr:hypothetical protein [Aureimonas sp. AU12]
MTRRPDETTDAYHARLVTSAKPPSLLARVRAVLRADAARHDITDYQFMNGDDPLSPTVTPDQPQAVPDDATNDPAYPQFLAYFEKNYPGPETIIYDPKWHAPKIFRAARHALVARPVLPVETPAENATRITIDLRVDGDSLRVQVVAGADPAETLNRAMAALKAERDALDGCPMHQPVETPAEGLREAERIARIISASYGEDPDEDAPIGKICGPNNEPLPCWMAYEEQAEAIIASTAPAPLSGRDGSLRETVEIDATSLQERHIMELRVHADKLRWQMENDERPAPPHGWTCFHCAQTFTTWASASAHFGDDPLQGRPECWEVESDAILELCQEHDDGFQALADSYGPDDLPSALEAVQSLIKGRAALAAVPPETAEMEDR